VVGVAVSNPKLMCTSVLLDRIIGGVFVAPGSMAVGSVQESVQNGLDPEAESHQIW
jgi:hypothetical protein